MGDLDRNTQASAPTSITDEKELHKAEVDKGGDSRNRLKVEAELANDNEILCKLDELITAVKLSTSSKNQIVDGMGTGLKSKVNKFSSLKVYNQNIPDIDDPTLLVPKSGFLVDSNQSLDLRVDGSTTPVDFTLNALDKDDVFVSGISFKIADANAQLNRFGNLPSLNNGLQLIYKSQDLGERILIDAVQTNFDLVRACQGVPAFSQGTESFRASNIIGGSEGYLPVLKIKEVFSLPFGLRLKAGTLDQLIVRVRDDLTNLDAFDVFYYASEYINN